jgi:hypothetical protein
MQHDVLHQQQQQHNHHANNDNAAITSRGVCSSRSGQPPT